MPIETFMVICGFLGPLIIIGIIGIFHTFYTNKKEQEENR
jgi:hypothetical protein